MKEKCAWCGEDKKVYAWQEGEYEEGMETYDKYFVAERKPLEGDVVGYPICEQCFKLVTGVDNQ